jgi:hypothetical protein
MAQQLNEHDLKMLELYHEKQIKTQAIYNQIDQAAKQLVQERKQLWNNKKLNLRVVTTRKPCRCPCGVPIAKGAQVKIASKIIVVHGNYVLVSKHYCHRCKPLGVKS